MIVEGNRYRRNGRRPSPTARTRSPRACDQKINAPRRMSQLASSDTPPPAPPRPTTTSPKGMHKPQRVTVLTTPCPRFVLLGQTPQANRLGRAANSNPLPILSQPSTREVCGVGAGASCERERCVSGWRTAAGLVDLVVCLIFLCPGGGEDPVRAGELYDYW